MNRRVTIDTDRVVFKVHINDEGDIEVVLNTQDNVLIKVEANNRFTFKLEKPMYNSNQDKEQREYYTTMTGVRKRELQLCTYCDKQAEYVNGGGMCNDCFDYSIEREKVHGA